MLGQFSLRLGATRELSQLLAEFVGRDGRAQRDPLRSRGGPRIIERMMQLLCGAEEHRVSFASAVVNRYDVIEKLAVELLDRFRATTADIDIQAHDDARRSDSRIQKKWRRRTNKLQ